MRMGMNAIEVDCIHAHSQFIWPPQWIIIVVIYMLKKFLNVKLVWFEIKNSMKTKFNYVYYFETCAFIHSFNIR
jgi:hypothetical protein